jgi:hypothetical protein
MKKNNLKNRFGGAILIIIIIVIIIGVIVGSFYGYKYKTGKELQEKQNKLWEEAFNLFNQQQPEASYLKLKAVRETFNENLDFYRSYASGSAFITKEEVNSVIVLICQSEIYNILFKLENASNWIEKAKEEIINIEDAETQEVFKTFIARAEAGNQYCAEYKKCTETENLRDEQYQELVKKSLKTASEALKDSDYDYTVFEIRFLIACGKSFKEPVLLTEARKQLFEITQASGENEQTKLLWSLLRN